MIIITSGAYIQGELRSEFGAVPPVYLPIGNQPLLSYQVGAIRKKFNSEHIVLSLPESFQPALFEQKRLKELDIEVISVPDGLSLSSSILYVINMVGRYSETTKILHGDTLIHDLPTEEDVVSVAHSVDDYDWYRINGNSIVWSGFFSFSHTRSLIRALAKNDRFDAAVMEYSTKYPLKQIGTNDWLDLGHLNTYYSAREKVTTQRAFNSLTISNGIVTKSGTPVNKIKAEADWFSALPLHFKPMIPAYYGKEEKQNVISYSLEYLPMMPLNELYVYGRHEVRFWEQIYKYYDDWFVLASQFSDVSSEQVQRDRFELIKIKTYKRLEQFQKDNSFDINQSLLLNNITLPSLAAIAEKCIEKSLTLNPIPGIFHGDLCFSNVLYDSRNKRLRVIDPRGMTEEGGLIGDIRYDLAKLMHSIMGFYDFIIAGHFSCKQKDAYSWDFYIHTSEHINAIVESFKSFNFTQFPGDVISESIPDMILLFISMLPFHSDNPKRQEALMCNALRLYSEYDKK